MTGTMPIGVETSEGEMRVISSPTRSPCRRTISMPRMMPFPPRSERWPAAMLRARSVTSPSRAGSIPRTTTPVTLPPFLSIACPIT
jgi:hypothetical protein